MLKVAKILTGVTMALLVFLLIVMFGVNVQVSLSELSAVPGGDEPERTLSMVEIARADDMASDLFKRPASTSAEDYQLITISVDVKNLGILPAEWLQLRVGPQLNDFALFPDAPRDLGILGSSGKVTATLLTEVGADASSREIWLQYYIFGRKMQVAVK